MKRKIKDILRLFHYGIPGGHLGVKITLIKIQQCFFWNVMKMWKTGAGNKQAEQWLKGHILVHGGDKF